MAVGDDHHVSLYVVLVFVAELPMVDGGQGIRQVLGVDGVEDKWVMVFKAGFVPALCRGVQD